jgi:uncharacterized protein
MLKKQRLTRRKLLGVAAGSMGGAMLSGCGKVPGERYNQADIDALAHQRQQEREQSGKGTFGRHVYQGYRGLSELPWFDLDDNGQLLCTDDSVPRAIDVHCHLGMSVLFRPSLDLLAATPRTRYLLDCDATDPGCELDLDVYINANFSPEALDGLDSEVLAQGTWGSASAATHTIPNLLEEMDAMRVEHAMLLPIKFGFPFGDKQTEYWRDAVSSAQAGNRLHAGLSVYPGDADAVTQMQQHAAQGGRILKLHPTVQRFFPDDPAVMDVYAEAQRLGLVIFFHGGRAGIEPESSHPYAMPRHYEQPIADFPELQFILGHGGARDGEGMLQLSLKYSNAWLGTHGQGVTHLDRMIEMTQGERLLFGTDWPFYHLGASLAKVLIVTESNGREKIRRKILRENALRLFSGLDTA